MKISKTTAIWIALGLALLGLAIAARLFRFNEIVEMSRFRSHRADYETLMTMLRHDQKLTFVNSGLTEPEDPSSVGISAARIAEYRHILLRLGRGCVRYDRFIGTAFFCAGTFSDYDILFFPI
ncbi:MAG TPA: hypothetical protein VIE42_02075, partial [Steroidobacteraceae bacterium]